MNIRLGVIGASGRMGKEILGVLPAFPQFSLAALIVSQQSSYLGLSLESAVGTDFGAQNAGEASYAHELEDAFEKCDALVDFSTPQVSSQIATLAAKKGKPVLIGTTGQDSVALEALKSAGRTAPILLARNTSIGIVVLQEVATLAQRLLGEAFDAEIVELHHARKKDAPSGTALRLAQSLQDGKRKLVCDRGIRQHARAKEEIGISSLRGGNNPGEHSILFLGEDERLELAHRVTDRRVFARGALQLLATLVTLEPGFYEPKDLIYR